MRQIQNQTLNLKRFEWCISFAIGYSCFHLLHSHAHYVPRNLFAYFIQLCECCDHEEEDYDSSDHFEHEFWYCYKILNKIQSSCFLFSYFLLSLWNREDETVLKYWDTHLSGDGFRLLFCTNLRVFGGILCKYRQMRGSSFSFLYDFRAVSLFFLVSALFFSVTTKETLIVWQIN